jgi:mannose-6-phosphate isomerase-like protein (cupin superfamily)
MWPRTVVATSEESTMAGYTTNIEHDTRSNDAFRRVLFTAERMQLVLMTLQPGDNIGMETHEDGDQFFRVESGEGEAILDGVHHALADGVVVVIPAGTEHDIVNTSSSAPLARLHPLRAAGASRRHGARRQGRRRRVREGARSLTADAGCRSTQLRHHAPRATATRPTERPTTDPNRAHGADPRHRPALRRARL